jgi:hypothetical protein
LAELGFKAQVLGGAQQVVGGGGVRGGQTQLVGQCGGVGCEVVKAGYCAQCDQWGVVRLNFFPGAHYGAHFCSHLFFPVLHAGCLRALLEMKVAERRS